MSENTTRSLESIEDEIRAVKEYIESYKTKLRESEEIRRKIKSRDFIAANEITMADVELSSGDDRPYFGDVWNFAKWLKSNSAKRFAEWNGQICFQSDLIAGKLRTEHMHATIDDLKDNL